MDATQAASLLQAADNAPGGLPGGLPGVGNLGSKLLNSNQIDASSTSKEENSSSYMIMSPQGKHIFYPAKGQLILKCSFGVFKLTKKPTKFLQWFLP